MNLKAEFITSKSSDNEWSGVYGFRPDNHKEFFELGELFAVIRVSTEVENFALENFAKILLDELNQSYFGTQNNSESLLKRLEDAVWKLKTKMEFILQREKEIQEVGIDMEMGIVSIVENSLYAVTIGESKICILREDNFVNISDLLEDTKGLGFSKSGSLELENKDRVLLATSKTKNTEEELSNIMFELNPNKLRSNSEITGASVMMLGSEDLDWVEMEVYDEVLELDEEGDLEEDQNLNISQEQEEFIEERVEQIAEVQSEMAEEGLNIPIEEGPSIKEQAQAKFSVLKSGLLAKFSKASTEESVSSEGDDFEFSYSEANNEGQEEPEFNSKATKTNESSAVAKEKFAVISVKVKSYLGLIAASLIKFKNKAYNYFENNQTTYSKIIYTVLQKIRSLINKIYGFIEVNILGKSTRRFAYDEKRRIKRNRLAFAVVFTVLTIFIYTNVQSARESRANQKRKEQAQAKYDDYNTRYTQLASDVVETTNAGSESKGQVLGALDQLQSEVKNDKSVSDVFKDEVSVLIANIEKSKDDIRFITPFTEPQIVTDIGAQFADSVLSDLEYSDGSLFISDFGRGVVYKIGTDAGSQLEVHASGLTNPSLLAKDANNDLVFIDSNASSAIGKFNPNTKESVSRFAALPEAEVGNIAEVSIFDGNNSLYELHQNHAQIFRRDQVDTGYAGGGALANFTSNPPNWRNDPEFTKAIDIAAPFEIYVLIEGKGLRRYFAGGDNSLNFDAFQATTQTDYESINNATAIDVSSNYVVVGVPLEKKIMLFTIDNNNPNKPLKLVKQFEYQGADAILSNIKEVKIVESIRKIYILDGGKIIRLDY